MMNSPSPAYQPTLAYGDEPDPDGRSSTPESLFDEPRPPRAVNWNLLTADEAELEWHDLEHWIKWLRHSFGLAPTVIPPLWHRHDELVWELSALHQYWLYCYETDGSPTGPIAWLREFPEARNRLREWVSTCGTKLDRDRPTRQTAWPGEPAAVVALEVSVVDAYADFLQFVREDVAARREIERHFRAST